MHQTANPLDRVENDDPRWFDRLYFGVHDRSGKLLLVTGLGNYPNTGVMDGYVAAVHNHVQNNLRLSRRLAGDRGSTQIGPLSFEVLEPHRRWAMKLGENPSGVHFSLEYKSRPVPYMVKKVVYPLRGGQPTGFSHFFQPGRFSGTISIGASRFEGDFMGSRDRSWGVRAAAERMGIHFWIQVQFSSFCISLYYSEDRDHSVAYLDGAVLPDNSEPVPIVDLRHSVSFDRDDREHTGGRLMVVDSRGQGYRLLSKQLSRGVYLQGAGYGGWHGQDRGRYHVEHEYWDLTRPDFFRSLGFPMYDQLAEFEYEGEKSVGIFEAGFSRSQAYEYKARV
ncbi:MAG: hypothetical protein HYX94_02800 [Chloroflexi bacterium]|nr:hypothetical protein [Chloroflexota bacterium]